MEKKYKFFLGGNDAEMEIIRNLLKENKQQFYEKELTWGAKLSEYKTEIENLTPEQIPVFIELALDISYPQNSIIVDHHNQNSGADKKTSIEQVADLLNLELNREQQLISANDRDMFKGMQLLNASNEEIEKVNELEKKAQNITDEDYKLAEKYYYRDKISCK